MDLSKVPTEDLQHIQNGNWEKVSTPGLQAYQAARQHDAQAAQQAQNPQQIPDAADKAAQNNSPKAQPITLRDQAARLSDNAAKSMLPSGLYDYLKPKASQLEAGVQGMAQGAMLGNRTPDATGQQAMSENPMSTAVGKAAGGFATGAAMGAGLGAIAPAGAGVLGTLGRIGVNAAGGAAAGAAENPSSGSDRTTGAMVGGALGAGGAGLAELIGGLGGAIKRPFQTLGLANNPLKAQQMASSAIQDATSSLKSSEAGNLAKYLGGKTLGVDTTEMRGVSPEVDSILDKYRDAYGGDPSRPMMDATDANTLRSKLDQSMTYKKLGPFAQTQETATKDAGIKTQADRLRSQLHDVSPDASSTYDQWSDNLNGARALDKGANNSPIGTLTSSSMDKQALLQQTDQQTGSNLSDLGSQLRAAKDVSNGGLPTQLKTLGMEAVKGGFKGAARADKAELIQPVMDSLFGAKAKNDAKQN